MAKDTKRDRVWKAVHELGSDPRQYTERRSASGKQQVTGFTKPDIRQHIAVDVSDRTIHDVVMSARDYGILQVVGDPVASVEHPVTGDWAQMNVYALAAEGPSSTPPAVETADSRYVAACPDCEYSLTRDQDSDVIKGIRKNERLCPDCGSRLELLKDDRPNPPVCPDCGEVAIEVQHADDEHPTQYVHGVTHIEVSGMVMREIDSCVVSE